MRVPMGIPMVLGVVTPAVVARRLPTGTDDGAAREPKSLGRTAIAKSLEGQTVDAPSSDRV